MASPHADLESLNTLGEIGPLSSIIAQLSECEGCKRSIQVYNPGVGEENKSDRTFSIYYDGGPVINSLVWLDTRANPEGIRFPLH